MKLEEAKLGVRVRYVADGGEGTVTEVGYCCFRVTWDDGTPSGLFDEHTAAGLTKAAARAPQTDEAG